LFCKNIIKKIIQDLNKASVLVIGDFVLDEMIYGTSHRISREAPVLILKHAKTDNLLGAASNAAHNVSKLNGGKVSAIGVVGDDYHGDMLKKALLDAKVDVSGLFVDKTRVTTTKTRISGSSAQSVVQQIVRVDRETKCKLNSETEEKLLEKIRDLVPHHDGILLSDYGNGVMTEKIISESIKMAEKHGKIIAVDAQDDLYRFKNPTIITPNQPDAERTLGYEIKDRQTLLKAGQDLLKMTNSDKVLLTRGSEGMVLFEKNGNIVSIPAINKTEVFDVTGAGDSVVASVLLALCTGAGAADAAIVGDLAASIVVRKFGAATTNSQELIENLEELEEINMEQINGCKI